MEYDKVFGVGLNKTGTTTLADMLGQLGLRHSAWSPQSFSFYRKGKIDALIAQCEHFDSFTDWPWPLVAPELLNHFGDRARFILTRRRDAQTWVESLKGHSLATQPGNNARQIVYGYEYPHENEVAHLEFYEQHLEGIRQLFRSNGRTDQLLEVCWEDGDGWPEVAEFLDLPAPKCALPHHNSKATRRKNLPHLAANLARIGSLVAH